MKSLLKVLLAAWIMTSAHANQVPETNSLGQIKTVFIILMENHNWEDIKGSAKAPYINSLLKEGASSDNYYNPVSLHPSEPNYIWLIAGDNHGVRNDDEPAVNGLHGVANVATQLTAKGISWKTYQENIDGKSCPLKSNMPYAAKHNPFVFFDNLTDGFNAMSETCITHNRPFEELKEDLAAGKVARYVFITPNMCNDMHGNRYCKATIDQYDTIKQGDAWLSQVVPMIKQSAAYKDNGALFITWDESEGRAEKSIGMIALSPLVKPGYVDSKNLFTHSAMLRTVEDIFALEPLGDASKSNNLGVFFK